MRYFFLLIILLFSGCSFNQPKLVSTATILIKTPAMKFYDKGFISKYTNYTQVQILSAGTAILKLKIYDDKICKDTFACQSLKSFNKEFLSASYEDDFLKKLFEKNQKKVVFRDRKNKILIKIFRD